MTSAAEGRRIRSAVAAMFFGNGFLMGSWAPQIPVFLTRLGIDEFTLGLLILLFGAGALAAMPVCGYLIHRHGSRRVLLLAAPACSFALLGVVATDTLVLAAPAMLVFGALIGGMDVAMNANAVAVESRLKRAIMSSSHGFWSLGGFAGGATGGFAIERFGHLPHAAMVTALTLAVVAAGLPFLAADAPRADAPKERYSVPRSATVYLIGVIALFSMVPEGAVLDWAALHLRQELGSDIAVAGFAYAAFSAAMAAMRFLGDGVRNRLGAVRTLRLSALLAGAGMLVGGLSTDPWLAIAAFALSGIGCANMVPIAFSAAGSQPGAALSTVTFMGYAGILAAPSAIGFVGGRTGFSAVFVALAFMLCAVAAMAGAARAADFAAPAD